MDIYNKGRRKFVAKDIIKKRGKGENEEIEVDVMPGVFTTFNDDDCAKDMLSRYPKELISSEDKNRAKADVGKLKAQDKQLKEKDAEIEALKKQLAEMKADGAPKQEPKKEDK